MEFVVKNDAELEALSNEEKTVYFREYQKHLHGKVEEAEKNATMTAEQVAEMKAKIDSLDLKEFKSMIIAVKEQGTAIRSMMESGEATVKASLKDILVEKKATLEGMKRDRNANFSIKAPNLMALSTNISGGDVPQAQREAGLNRIASRQIRLLDVVQIGTATSNLIEWVYQANQDGTAGPTAEAALKNQIDFDLVVGSAKVEKYTAFIKVTTEMLADIDFIETEIRNELSQELLKVVEGGVYSGSGVTPNMEGIVTVATAFAAGTFAGTVDNANLVDVLVVAMNQIKIAEQGMPNYIMLNPSDVTALKLVKVSSTDKRYVERLAMVGGQLSLDGIPIVETTLVPADEFLVGDFTKATVFVKEAMNIEFGYENDDFTKNLVTIRAEWRGATRVKQNDRTCFVTGTISTAITALETP